MNSTVYLLSIIGGCGIAIGLLSLVCFCVAAFLGIDNIDRSHRNGRRPICFAVVGSVLLVLAALIPSAESLKNAYLYTEAAKLVTAENGTKTAEEIAKRVDRVLEVFEKKACK